MFRTRLLVALLMGMMALRCGAAVPVYGYKVVATYPHSTESYTEGFSI
jgi:glutaminyl-peptide cyclotransferase